VGETIAALAAMGVCVLAPTGLLMAWKRLLMRRNKSTARHEQEVTVLQ
jgi:hypothetical protein